jgi:hypothetical protein
VWQDGLSSELEWWRQWRNENGLRTIRVRRNSMRWSGLCHWPHAINPKGPYDLASAAAGGDSGTADSGDVTIARQCLEVGADMRAQAVLVWLVHGTV